eukprot:TRINITY_DN12235_c0_g1_i1.p1 TRINITY_DN12235_c0_g1~~TRINITY_DN12235_c0_g1_i1.p1  ORF type:complete len:226 (-),score=64.63 TRINITY_DN12235_c0_g1_i1:44-721(-)
MMEWFFGKRKTPEEIVKENQKLIKRSMREIERERRRMKTSQQQQMNEIRKSVKDGQMNAARIMAKDLVRTRKHIEDMGRMKTQLQGVLLRIQSVRSQHAMSEAMRGVTRAMVAMNRQINLPSLQHIMMEFEKQSEIMDMKQEAIGDTMEDMMTDEYEERDTEDIIDQIIDDISLNLQQELVSTPQAAIGNQVGTPTSNRPIAQGVGGGPTDDDLLNRYNDLRGDD